MLRLDVMARARPVDRHGVRAGAAPGREGTAHVVVMTTLGAHHGREWGGIGAACKFSKREMRPLWRDVYQHGGISRRGGGSHTRVRCTWQWMDATAPWGRVRAGLKIVRNAEWDTACQWWPRRSRCQGGIYTLCFGPPCVQGRGKESTDDTQHERNTPTDVGGARDND